MAGSYDIVAPLSEGTRSAFFVLYLVPYLAALANNSCPFNDKRFNTR